MVGQVRRLRESRDEFLILDSGAVIADSRGNRRTRTFLERALARGIVLIVPPIVITETYRGTARDAPIDRLLKDVVVPEADVELAKAAGRLLAATNGSNAADAEVIDINSI